MKFGLSLFGLSPRHWVEVATLAEECGFESLWAPEHLVFPATTESRYPYSGDGRPPVVPATPLYDPWVLFGAVAAATERIRLATAVYVLPLRHPIPVARTLVTLDVLSRGRVTLGAGVGWLEEEFAAVDQGFADRGERMDEMVEILRALWTDDVVEHHGRHFRFGPVCFAPKPVRPSGIPIELGGASRPALRRAGRLGDGWIEVGAGDLDGLVAMMQVIEQERRAAGRDHLPFEVTSQLPRTPDDVKRYADHGVTRVRTRPPVSGGRTSLATVRDFVQQYRDDVISTAA